MERLTYPLLRDSENQAYDSKYGRETLLHRLAAYEDTGLMPEEILDPVEMAKVAMALKENTHLRSQLAEVTAERDAAVEDLTRLANGNKDCGACAHIGDSIDKCEYTHTGDCFEWRGLRKEKANEKVQG